MINAKQNGWIFQMLLWSTNKDAILSLIQKDTYYIILFFPEVQAETTLMYTSLNHSGGCLLCVELSKGHKETLWCDGVVLLIILTSVWVMWVNTFVKASQWKLKVYVFHLNYELILFLRKENSVQNHLKKSLLHLEILFQKAFKFLIPLIIKRLYLMCLLNISFSKGYSRRFLSVKRNI